MAIHVPPSFQTDPARVHHQMVVCGQRAYVLTHTDPRRTPLRIVHVVDLNDLEYARELATLAHIALWHQCTALWLLPAGGASPDPLTDSFLLTDWQNQARQQIQRARHALGGDLTWHELTSSHGGAALSGLVAQAEDLKTGKGKGAPLTIVAPWVNDAWGLSGAIGALHDATSAALALTFATGLALAAFALNMQLRFSPSYVGLNTLRQELGAWEQNANREIPELTDETRALLDQPGLMPSYHTWRAGDLEALAQAYADARKLQTQAPGLWVYDRNSSFPSSFRDMPLGAPRPIEGEWRQHVPGVYLVTGIEPPARWPEHIPGPFRFGEGEGTYPQRSDGYTWAWEPQLRLAHKFGWSFVVGPGYYWPRDQVMDPKRWYTRYWAARHAVNQAQVTPEARKLARALVKKVGVATVGRLRQRTGRALVDQQQAEAQGLDILAWDVDQAGLLTGQVEVETLLGRTDLNQPAWWASTIANANERLLFQVYGTAWDTGLTYVDSLYTLRPHIELAGESEKPGGFRANGFIPLLSTDWRALASASSVGEAVKYLAHLEHRTDPGTDGEDLLLETLASPAVLVGEG